MHSEKQQWEEYKSRTLARLKPILESLGLSLEEEQPHLTGERYLTRPVGGGRKLLLIGTRISDGARVVIKASDEQEGIAEIAHERLCREVLERISFAYQAFHSPAEILYTKTSGFLVLVTEFIEQERPFTERPLPEQFMLALKAFKVQESAHATTDAHVKLIRTTFGEMTSGEYERRAQEYAEENLHVEPNANAPLLAQAVEALRNGATELARYGGFLTHWDFTPQNIRVRGGEIYLLDHSAIRFGNKYEGWARFSNFMELYNPPLAKALVRYVRENRSEGESLAFRLMRIYRLLELIRYYAGWLARAQGPDDRLARERIRFWSQVLEHILSEKDVPADIVEAYKHIRDSLRSPEERRRQVGLH